MSRTKRTPRRAWWLKDPEHKLTRRDRALLRGDDGVYPSEVVRHGVTDEAGTFKIDPRNGTDWTGSRNQSRRHVNHQRRQAKRIVIANALLEAEDDVEEINDDGLDDFDMEYDWLDYEDYDPRDYEEPVDPYDDFDYDDYHYAMY